MKRYLLLILSLITACAAGAQVSTQNYIRTRTMLNEAGNCYQDNIAYYDGLGRAFQGVNKNVKNGVQTGSILATLQKYDAAGRETNAWLPVAVSADYVAMATLKTMAKGSGGYGDAYPYSRSVYETSSLNRMLQQYGPGVAWHNGHPVENDYMANTATSPLNCLNYDVSSSGTLTNGGYYAANQLSVVKTTDEDGNTGYTFTDKRGRTLLIRQMKGSETHDTYYVYDDSGNLCFVLQPMYQSNANLDQYAFQYKYDGFNRCIWKKLPGAGYIEYTYDAADRLTFSQDGNQRAGNKWTYYLYDNLGRLTQQGECTNKSVASGKVVQIQNYYDNYAFVGGNGFTASQFTKDTSGHGKGALTGQMVAGINVCSPVWKAFYYDIRGREVKRVESNAMSGYDVTTTAYSFTNKPLTMTHTHTSSSKNLVEVYTYSYDHADRLLKVQHKLDNLGTVTLAEYGYDNLGRLNSKKLGGTAHSSAYSYNIRSWLTGITGGKFTQTLTYNSGTAGYNGNITAMNWTVNGESHRYDFAYDGLNRLTAATHGAGRFTEKVSSYDKNGNIKNLQRYGQTGASTYGLIDNLTYTLNGNQLNRVDDAASASAYNGGFEFKDGVKQANEYVYDANGNLTKDLNKGITEIRYNCLNLPISFIYASGGFSQFGYTADGVKRREIFQNVSGRASPSYIVYCGNVIYENKVAKLLITEEGYVTLSDNAYHYYVKDHQGNNRLVVNSSGAVEEVNHYYPFGGLFANSTSVQPYKYNGKELNTKKGLNLYDYGARQYDAALGRFHTNDRLAEKYYSISTYQYGANNPIRNVDVNGDSIVVLNYGNDLEHQHMAMLIQNETGKWQYFSINGNNVYISGEFSGGRPFDDLGVGEYNNPQEFMDSPYNSYGNKDDLSINHYGFPEGYMLPTDKEQDNIIRKTFVGISQNEDYDFLGNNCTTATQRALEAAGIQTYDKNRRSYRVPANHYLGESSYRVTHENVRPIVPSTSFKSIIRHNPHGEMILKNKR